MSPPIRDGSGNSIGSIRLGDGSEISEVRTGAGDVLFSAGGIPDAPVTNGLYRRFYAGTIDESDGYTVTTGDWTDTQASDDMDVISGSPTYKTGVIAGNDVVRTDGSDDRLATVYPDLSQPFEFIIIGKQVSTGGQTVILGNTEISDFGDHRFGERNDNYVIYSGSDVAGGTPDKNKHLFDVLWRSGSNDELYVDGAQTVSGNAGDDNSDGISIGGRADNNSYSNFDYAEIQVFNKELSSSERSDIETYANNQYSI